ncbi:hypothetical protein R6X40_17930 [Rhizobium sp. PL01]|nr:hypothetical protein [Rhizobium sp. PL01]MDW5316001.1 hypothetical protein [Rhizobium sp. PL01]
MAAGAMRGTRYPLVVMIFKLRLGDTGGPMPILNRLKPWGKPIYNDEKRLSNGPSPTPSSFMATAMPSTEL